MLTPKQEAFCQYIEIEKLSQYEAYTKAYPVSKTWKRASVDTNASELANSAKILRRRKELRDKVEQDARQEAKWTREDAFKSLNWLISKAKQEIEEKGETTSPAVSAVISSVKELNTIYAVADKSEGGGVLEDILDAVRGLDND